MMKMNKTMTKRKVKKSLRMDLWFKGRITFMRISIFLRDLRTSMPGLKRRRRLNARGFWRSC
jgi:hypothetical protein